MTTTEDDFRQLQETVCRIIDLAGTLKGPDTLAALGMALTTQMGAEIATRNVSVEEAREATRKIFNQLLERVLETAADMKAQEGQFAVRH